MAYLDKYGNLRDDKTGGVIGIKRESGESDESYASRGDAKMAQVNVYGDGTVSSGGQILGKTNDYTTGKLTTYSGQQQPVTPQMPQYDIQAEIEKLRKAQTDAAVASLGKAKDSALSNLSREKEQIAPTYYAKKNAASTGSQLAAKNFAEYMASRGGTSSGVSAQAELNRQGSLQGNIGSLNKAEANAFIENGRRVTDVGNAYVNDVAAAEAGAYAQSLQNMISQMNQDRAFQQAQDQFAKQFGLSEAGVTGYYNSMPTLANQQYQTGLDQWNKQYETGLDQYNQEYADNKAQQEFENWLAQQQLALSQQKASSGGGGGEPSQDDLMGEAYSDVQTALARGTSPETVKQNILNNASEYERMGINYKNLISYADAYAESKSSGTPESTMNQLNRYLNFIRGQ